ncbi:hypothetical protein FACS189497_12530 [Betaproteobacteria bacterium]|nr:hypothetical protein FACS189497_12530 [Betaproteobacteria bacterium]
MNTTTNQLAQAEICYALSKHIRDMKRGFTIHTNYGDLEIEPKHAARIASILTRIFEQKLKGATK